MDISRKKIILISSIVGIGILLVCAVFFAPARNVSWESSQSSSPLAQIGTFFKNIFSKQDISVVVLGRSGVGYNGGALTDSIMVVHFNPQKNAAYLISIPRDLWVTDDSAQFKINEALHRNNPDLVLDRAEQITGLSMDGYVVVDLALVQSVVDYLGGVDVTLKEPATDWVSGYTLDVGTHHLSGEDAVWLMRNRFNSQGDFFREGNQQAIIKDVMKKFGALSKGDKVTFFRKFILSGSLLEHTQIDFSKFTPYIFESSLGSVSLHPITLDFTTKLLKSTSIPIQGATGTVYSSALVPTEGFEKYDAIRTYVEEKMK